MVILKTSAIACAVWLAVSASALACQDGWSSTSLGFCTPNVGGDGADLVSHYTREQAAQIYGPQLAAWIQTSRETALAGAHPIPPEVRRRLTGFVDEAILDLAWYKVGDAGSFNVAGLSLHFGDFNNANVRAVTLYDVIVFRDDSGVADLALWAHELYHVRQYRDWGYLDFGKRYVRNTSLVEDPAYNEENRWNASAQMRQQGAPLPTGFQNIPPGGPVAGAPNSGGAPAPSGAPRVCPAGRGHRC